MSYISILNHSSLSVCQNGQRRMCMERFNEGLFTILTCSSVWLSVWVCECERERDQGGVCGRWRAHWFVQCVCIDVWMIVCVWEAYCKHAALLLSVRVTIVCMSVCIQYVCACACLCLSECVFQYMSISFLSQSCYSTFIPLVGLYPVLLCLWI